MTRLGGSARDGVITPRPAGNSRNGRKTTGQLSLPAHMYRALPEGALFRAEWHEDGILYRFLGVAGDAELQTDPPAPDWTKRTTA